jgi:hypothetical protein
MSEHQHSLNGGESTRSAQKHEHLYLKSLEELYDELAALNDQVADGDIDLDLIDAYLDAINTKETLPFNSLDPEESFAIFSEKHALLFDENTTTAPKASRRIHSLPRKIAVAILAAVLGCSAIASASGFDIFGAVAQWTKDFFSFGSSASIADVSDKHSPQDLNTEYASIQEALDELAINEEIVPHWLPGGFKLNDIETSIMQNSTKIRATFECDDGRNFRFTIRHFATVEDALKANVEKTEENVEAYTVNNIPHYILSNTQNQKATWLNNSTLAIISGDLSEEEIKTMIDSIYER